MPSINIRLARLEQSAAGPLPAHIRRWLGESLTEAENNQAMQSGSASNPGHPSTYHARAPRHATGSADGG